MSKLQKTIAVATAIATGLVMSGATMLAPIAAQAATAEELQAQINDLLATITALQAQLASLNGGSSSGTVTGASELTAFLKKGSSGDQVKSLQTILNSTGHNAGTVDGSFGPKTEAAVKSYQAAKGLVADGLVGKNTRAALNAELSSGGTTPPPADTGGNTGGNDDVVVPPVAGDQLQIMLASDTPASASVATGGNANFTKLVLTAGSADVDISKIKVSQTGQSTSSDIQNIKVIDEDGVSLGTTGSLDTNNKSTISFTSPKIEVKAGTSKVVYLRAGVPSSGATAGRTITLGIASADDVTATSPVVVVSGTGNPMTILSLTIGSVTVDQDAATSDSSPDVGDTDVVLNRFKISINSTEDVVIDNIEALEVGTASLDDIENLELYSVTDSKTLSEVANWSAQGKVSFTNLNLKIEKGETHRFEIRADIVDGTGLTTNADVIDGSDVLVTSKGEKYGYYITASDGGNWSNSNAGRGSSNQTISSGAVIVSRSSSSAAVGNVAQADNQELATFELDVRGEPVRITSFRIGFVGGTSNAAANTDTEISNVRIYDETNNETHGPYDVSTTDVTANSTTYGSTVTTTDLIILPVGVHKFTVSAKVSTNTSNGDSIYVGFPDPDSDLTIKGETSNDSITASPTSSNVNGNTQTVQAGSLTATTSAIEPVARTITAGAQNVLLLKATLDAQGSGENVEVSQIVVEDTMDATSSNADDWTGVEVYADLTSASHATRGDAYETRVAVAPSGEPNDSGATDELITFTLSPTITISKNSYVDIAVFGDLKSSATDADTHTWSLDTDSGDVTATGVDTGSSVSVTPSGAGQTLTISTSGGTVVATTDASQPDSQIIAENETGVIVGAFRLEADAVEDHDLQAFKITNTGSATAVSKYYFYASERSDGVSASEPIGTATGAATAEISGLDGKVKIPASGYVVITVKADFPDVNTSAASNGDTVVATVATTAGEIDTIGLSSGTGTDPSVSSALTPNTHYLYEAYPVFTLNSNSPSGDLNPSTLELVAIYDVTAVGGNDITFDSAESNTLTIDISSSKSTDSTANDAFELRDAGGTVLASPADVNINGASGTTTVEFTFEDNSNAANAFTVPKGQTKELRVYADLDGLTSAGDFIQVKLDDVASHINFSVNGGTTNDNRGDIIFRGEIKANRLQRNINS